LNLRDIARYLLVSGIAFAVLAACNAAATPTAPASATAFQRSHRAGSTQQVQNVIVILQEERSFDNLFAGFPGADAPTKGLTSTGKYVPLRRTRLEDVPKCVGPNDGGYFKIAYDGGKMDGWNLLNGRRPLCPYTRVERSEVAPYWRLARSYAVADNAFASTRFDQFVDQLYLIAGTTKIAPGTFDVNPVSAVPWNCEAPAETKTSVLTRKLKRFQGPFPCFDQFPTIATLLDAASVPWRFYYGGKPQDAFPFNPFSAIASIREGPDWHNDMSVPATNVLSDLAGGNLAPVSWVLSAEPNSDFPGYGGGPAWVKAIVQAAQASRYWQHIAVVVVWNDPGDGNFYDNASPPQLDAMGLGFRVPMLVVSPYAKRGYVSHTQYEFGSILKFIEENWSLGSLGSTDVRANSIGDMFGGS
jgi:phospholipase C